MMTIDSDSDDNTTKTQTLTEKPGPKSQKVEKAQKAAKKAKKQKAPLITTEEDIVLSKTFQIDEDFDPKSRPIHGGGFSNNKVMWSFKDAIKIDNPTKDDIMFDGSTEEE